MNSNVDASSNPMPLMPELEFDFAECHEYCCPY